MAIPTFKDLKDLLGKSMTIEAQKLILELQEQQLKDREEILKLKERLGDAERRFSSSASLIYEAPYYWKTQGTQREGPFCQVCHDKTEKLVRLQQGYDRGHWTCLVCQSGFGE